MQLDAALNARIANVCSLPFGSCASLQWPVAAVVLDGRGVGVSKLSSDM